MRAKKRLWVFGVVLLSMITLAGWMFFPRREPVYGGKPLSIWLQGYTSEFRTGWSGGSDETADEAVRQIGSNAIPVLVRELMAKDSPITLKLFALAGKQNLIPVHFDDAERRNFRAEMGFRALGDKGQAAVPTLMRAYERSSSPELKERIATVYKYMGPLAAAAVPSLLSAMTNANDSVRASAAEALWLIHSQPDAVVPVLIRALDDPDSNVRLNALRGLAMFHSNSRSAIPVLLRMSADTNESIRSEVMDAFRLIHSDPDLVVPVLITALRDSNDFVRARAAFAVGTFGTNSRLAIPLLLSLARETNDTVRDLAVGALAEIHLEPNLVVPALTSALGDSQDWIRANAAEGLGAFGTNAASALPALIKLYLKEQQVGPRTRSDRPDMIKTLEEAIRKIDSEVAANTGIK